MPASADLTAADGSKLGNTIEKEVYTGDLDPAVGFASQGSVLPARESRGPCGQRDRAARRLWRAASDSRIVRAGNASLPPDVGWSKAA